MLRNILLPLVLIMLATVACAHDNDPIYDRVSLNASAEQEVENDTLVAVLFAEHQAQRQKDVSRVVNEAVRWALDKAKGKAGIKVQTTQYNTSPVYTKNVVTGWRARQSIRLESSDADAIGELIGELQEQLSIGSINYAVSKAARDAVEEALTSAALKQFKRRAELIASDLGRKTYRIVQLHINTQSGGRQPVVYAARVAKMEAAPAPAIEAGVQTVTVDVSGTIEVDAGAM